MKCKYYDLKIERGRKDNLLIRIVIDVETGK